MSASLARLKPALDESPTEQNNSSAVKMCFMVCGSGFLFSRPHDISLGQLLSTRICRLLLCARLHYHRPMTNLESPVPGVASQAVAAVKQRPWLVLVAAFLGWMFDGLEMGVFPLVARPALQDLLRVSGDAQVGRWMGYITASFLIGAATGGLLFGWLG